MTIRTQIDIELEVATALHTSADATDGVVDATVLRDGLDRPIVSGASFAGALRALAARMHLASPDGTSAEPADDEELLDRLFGRAPHGRWGEDGAAVSPDRGRPSRLWVSDLVADGRTSVGPRTGVGIDATTGTADRGVLYDRDVLPPGTRLRGRLVLEAGQARDLLEVALARMLVAILHEGIDLGGGRSRGEGRCTVIPETLAVRRVDMDDPSAVATVLDPSSAPVLSDPVTDMLPIVKAKKRKQQDRPTDWHDPAYLRGLRREPVHHVAIAWRAEQPVFSASSVNPLALDIIPQTEETAEGRRLVLRGSSLKGVLRHHAERIIRTISDAPDDLRMRPVAWLFGTADVDPRLSGRAPGRGALRIADCHADNGAHRQLTDVVSGEPDRARGYEQDGAWFYPATHVSIDRWTGGAAEGRLFDVLEPVGVTWPPLRIEVRMDRLPPDGRELGASLALLSLVLRDLVAGRIAFGFGTRRGRGTVKVTAVADIPPWRDVTGGEGADIRNVPWLQDHEHAWREWLASLDEPTTETTA